MRRHTVKAVVSLLYHAVECTAGRVEAGEPLSSLMSQVKNMPACSLISRVRSLDFVNLQYMVFTTRYSQPPVPNINLSAKVDESELSQINFS